MAIYWRCPDCRTLNSLAKKRCSCGASYPAPGKRRFVVQVRYGGVRRTAVAQTLAQAKEVEVMLKEELIRRKYMGPSAHEENCPSLSDFYLKQYLPWVRVNLKEANKYEAFFKKWILPRMGDKSLNEITVCDVENLKRDILCAGRSPRTAQHILSLLKAVLNKARNWGILKGDNPVSKVKVPKFDNRRVRFLSYDEANMLLEKCKEKNTSTNHIYLIVLMALTTGMRAGEIFNLKWQDVDFDNNIIHIRDPKSGENRTTFLSPDMKEHLIEFRKDQKPSDYVFTNSKGKPFRAVPDVWKTIIKELGFNKGVTDRREKVVFHTLRHTFCSWLALSGVPLHVIKELAGHKTIQMTERYAHLLPDVRRKAAERVWGKLKI